MKEANRFADSLLSFIKDILVNLGFHHDVVAKWDQFIYIAIILIIAFLIGRITRIITVYTVNKLIKIKQIRTLKVLAEYNAFHSIARLIPPLIVIVLLPFALENTPKLLDLTEKICWIYFVIVLLLSSNVLLSSVWGIFSQQTAMRNRPMKGLIQILQALLSFIAIIVVVSILLNKSPLNLITGLGAFAAVLMLIFKDSILGFVAGVQLSQNDMIRHGDWISTPDNFVNGVIIDITLNTVKVQNFDNTIVTIPPYSLISAPLQNWRGMADSGGRRIMRSYTIDLNSVQFCTPDKLAEWKKIELLENYITTKEAQLTDGREANTDNPDGLVNGTIETNLGVFRAYMTLYLRNHTFINQQLTLMVRTLTPNDNGLPLELYCFSANKDWVSYESIQAEIMEHFAAVMPRFGLYPFQNPSGRDYINSALLEAGTKTNALSGIPWGTIRQNEDPESAAEPIIQKSE